MRSFSRKLARARTGRLLVECLVASLLLDALALGVVMFARATATASQRALDTTAAWAVAQADLERALVADCDSTATPALLPQAVAREVDFGAWREREIHVVLTLSPLTSRVPVVRTMHAARSCP